MIMNEIDVMSRLLELGGTMLAEHCSCGAPLFRYQGQVGCPICDFKMTQNGGAKEVHEEERTRREPRDTKESPETAGYLLTDLVSEKIREIASNMQKETDLGRVRDQMDCIERGIAILEMLDRYPFQKVGE